MLIRLVVETDGNTTSSDFDVTEVVIGRHAECALPLGDQRASRRHCRVMLTPQGVLLEDLGSANGTLLNGKPVEKSLISIGDEIRIGDTRIWLGERPGPTRDEPPDDVVDEILEATEDGADAVWGEFEALSGPLAGRRIPLTGDVVVIGRSRSAEITLKDVRVSGEHVRIEKEGDRRVIVDLGSTNGILLDGRRIDRAPLVTGAILTVGESRFRATVPGTVPASTPAAARPGTSAGRARARRGKDIDVGMEEMVLEHVDVERVMAGHRFEQPLVLVGSALLVGFVAYFMVDILGRVMAREDRDPGVAANSIENWSFERAPEGADPAVALEWRAVGGARLERTTEDAQFPGGWALRVTGGGDEPSGAEPQELVDLGVHRRFVLGASIVNRGARFAGVRIEWLRPAAGGVELMGTTWSEAVRDPRESLDVYEDITAPRSATQARIACVVFGGSGTAVFDRVSFVPAAAAASDASGEMETSRSIAAGDVLSIGDERSGFEFIVEMSGRFAVRSRSDLALPEIWGGLGPDRDPHGFGPDLVPVQRESGDGGAIVLSGGLLDATAGGWIGLESEVSGAQSEVAVRWKLLPSIGESDGADLTVYIAAASTTPVLIVGDAGAETTFADARSEGVTELAVGDRRSRLSVLFSRAVSVAPAGVSRVPGRTVLAFRVPGAQDIGVRFVPGSLSEKQAAIALLQEAARLHQDGEHVRALAMLDELETLYPAEESQVERARALRTEWQGEASALAAALEEEFATLRRQSNDAIVAAFRARVAANVEGRRGSREADRLERLLADIDSFVEAQRRLATDARMSAILGDARRLYEGGQLALAELVLVEFVEDAEAGKDAEEANLLLSRIRERRDRERDALAGR